MYRGRYMLGEQFALAIQCVNNNGTPSEPSAAPVAIIMSDSAQILTMRLPILDRYGATGFFQHPLLLDGQFSTGRHRVVYQWVISGTAYSSLDDFDIAAGGQIDGAILGLYYFAQSGKDHLLQPTDSGRLIRKRNPRV